MAAKRTISRSFEPEGLISQVARIHERANLLLKGALEKRKLKGLVPAHGSLLAYLFRQPEPVPIKDVVSAVGRVKSTVTGMLNTLERHGYIRRERDSSDSRVILVSLTDKGLGVREDFEHISKNLIDAVYGTMPQRDREKLIRLLDEVEQNLIVTERTQVL